MENIKIKATDGLNLSCIYSKALNPRAICQIMHGMAEHKERYIELIEALTNAGITTIISDMRGHGESVSEDYPLGMVGEIDQLVADQYEVTKYLKKHNPNLPMYVFSHSMGTLVSRAYIEVHDDEIERLILSGTVCFKPGVGLGVFLAKCKSLSKKGRFGYSKLLWAMSNNASFDPSLDWLSYSKENIKNYLDDPLCGFKFTNFSNKVLFELTQNLHKKKRYQVKNPTLRIYSISGEDDRTTGGEKGLKDTLKSLLLAGYIDMKYKTYPNMKHEILMEENHQEVIDDILKFFGE